MKVFISWSGNRSGAAANALKKWLPTVLQSLDPWFSKTDIESGAAWSRKVSTELQESKYGIVCLTPENLSSPWILFEAGAIFKGGDETRPCTLLFGLKASDIKQPLGQFQATVFGKEGVFKLLQEMNQASDRVIDEGCLTLAFERLWPDLDSAIAQAMELPAEKEPDKRDDNEILGEILGHARATAGRIDSLEVAVAKMRTGLIPVQMPISSSFDQLSKSSVSGLPLDYHAKFSKTAPDSIPWSAVVGPASGVTPITSQTGPG